ncbi:hypothetical protein RRSWK_00061 [Rhodopirellula sp. SWK7]|nr:hypothetical protein RRSWK_00061 [Rhodopirellula sp. SWK7]
MEVAALCSEVSLMELRMHAPTITHAHRSIRATCFRPDGSDALTNDLLN